MSVWLATMIAAAAAGGSAALATRRRVAALPAPLVPPSRSADERGWLRRGRPAWAVLGGLAAWCFLGGALGLLVGAGVFGWVWTAAGRAESPTTRRSRAVARRELPHLVGLLGDALRGGQPPVEALAVAAVALSGPAADRVASVLPRLRLGVDPGLVWSDLAADPDLGPLGRALARAHESGASAGQAVDRLAVDLARAARAEVEDRARSVGVRAAVPLTLCLLPAFVLLGIVPVVAGLLAGLGL